MTGFMRLLRLLLKVALVVAVGVASTFVSFFVVLVVLIALVVGIAAGDSSSLQPKTNFEYSYGREDSQHRLAAIEINGLILGSSQEASDFLSLFSDIGITFGYDVKDTLMELAEDDNIAGVVIEINSPGGTIYGTQAIVDGIEYYRDKTNKPVIAHIRSMAASGGYWVAVATDEVIVDHGTAVGSIGIITGPFKYYEDVMSESVAFAGSVETAGGITTEFITAGASKDLGNPYRAMTEQERDTLQQGANQSYDDFVTYVSARREISENQLREQIGALIYSDHQSVDLNLANAIMDRDEVYQHLAELSGATGDDFAVVSEQQDPSFIEVVMNSITTIKLSRATQQVATPGCIFESVVMAYHGDVRALCLR